MNNRKINNIIFDLSEVLLTGIRDTGINLVKKHNLNNGTDLCDIPKPLLIPLVEEFFNGNVSEDEYIKAVLNIYPQFGDGEFLKQHIRENFKEIDGTREIILKLKKLNYTLALLSVHGKEWIDYCEKKYNFHNLFDICSYSYDVKYSKPHHISFETVLNQLNASPEICLFIDDSETNIKAAESLGIKSILFTNAENLHHQLKDILTDFN